MTKTTASRSSLPEWQALERHCTEVRQSHLRDMVARDPQRFIKCSVEEAGLLFDYSRQRVTQETIGLLVDLAGKVGLQGRIKALFAGEKVNNTERRPALHMALRRELSAPNPGELKVDGQDILAEVRAEREKLERFVRGVHAGSIAGSAGNRFETVINIGIGGSDLGPVMAVEALARYRQPGIEVHFVSNVDGCQLSDALAAADPATTLVVICSKTFTTLETMTNARRARQWVVDHLGTAALAKHFAAVSTNAKAMDEFGIGADSRFTMWDWVGGRYSIWSSIGLTLALAIGAEHFRAFLEGGRVMDEHFSTAPLERNLPVLAGLLGVWNRNFLGIESLAVLPYDQRLHRFPAYLQQLTMESNGKRVTRAGVEVDYATGEVLWGEPGSNAQHSFFQLLHQGTSTVALDFLAPVQSSCGWQEQQNLALANCLAQAQAFMGGQPAGQVRAELERAGLGKDGIEALLPHKVHPGNRPSTVLLFQRLDPATLGKLIALYEHRVYVQSVVWDINPFDQWGVELGKKLADKLGPVVADPTVSTAPVDLKGLLEAIARWR